MYVVMRGWVHVCGNEGVHVCGNEGLPWYNSLYFFTSFWIMN